MDEKSKHEQQPHSESATPENGATPEVGQENAPASVPTDQAATFTDTTGSQAAATATPSGAPEGNSTAMIVGAIVVALLLIGGAWFFMTSSDPGTEGDQFGSAMPTDLEDGDPEDPVAEVNGVTLNRADFNRIRQQVLQTAQQQGMDLNDPEAMNQVNQQAMDMLINTELIRQAAVAAGVTVTEEEVAARFVGVLESVGGAEALEQSLQELGMTEESLRNDVEQELVIQAYLDTAMTDEFSASDEEIASFYQEVGGEEGGLPPLEEVRDQIEQQIVMTKEQEVVNELLEELRAEAEIEVLI